MLLWPNTGPSKSCVQACSEASGPKASFSRGVCLPHPKMLMLALLLPDGARRQGEGAVEVQGRMVPAEAICWLL